MLGYIRTIIFLAISFLFAFANAKSVTPPSFTNKNLSQNVEVYRNTVSLERRDLASEDLLRELAGLPPRFALTNKTFINPENFGTWESLDNQKSVWRLDISSKNAKSLNLGFTQFNLPNSASLYIYSKDHEQVRGPFTGDAYNQAQELWTPVVLGDELRIELVVDKFERKDVFLILGSVNHGYRGFGVQDFAEKSGSCNVDVACSISEGWEDQIKSVAVISTGGRTFCTGFLVNNTSQDGRPLFMTANHCRINDSNAASLVSYWNYHNSTCREPSSIASGSTGDGELDQFSTGATFRASGADSDFTIVEFNEDIDPEFDVFYSGWDARTEDPIASTAIHHPSTHEKRISFDYDPGTTTTYLSEGVTEGGTHIKVADWDVGTTEPGSSGSPLFDQNKRIVGQLHGGYAACGNDSADWYGRISYSWNFGLKEVLDPGNTGELFVDGLGDQLNSEVEEEEAPEDECSSEPVSASYADGLAIPDNDSQGVRATVSFSETEELATDIKVSIDLSHTYISDLKITLTSPSGVSVVLHDGTGYSSNNIVGVYPTDLSAEEDLSIFNGEELNGDWTLSVVDSVGSDVGVLNSTSIENGQAPVCR
jgi:subtilisin-like proprotein convertase family protein